MLLHRLLRPSEPDLEGAKAAPRAPPLPPKGAVLLECGGPPCQGFSGMNRFSHDEYSQLKRSAIVTYTSSADYLRPRYFILENVGDFLGFNGGEVSRLVLRTLVDIGYQVSVAVLQAGQFGVPQSRHRAIVLGAAPGYPLPAYPAPLYSFSSNALKTRTRMAIGPYVKVAASGAAAGAAG